MLKQANDAALARAKEWRSRFDTLQEVVWSGNTLATASAIKAWAKALGLEVWATNVSPSSTYVALGSADRDVLSSVGIRLSDHGNMASAHHGSFDTDVNIAPDNHNAASGLRRALEILAERLADDTPEPDDFLFDDAERSAYITTAALVADILKEAQK